MLYKEASFGGSVVVKVLPGGCKHRKQTIFTELNEQIQLICKMLKRYVSVRRLSPAKENASG